jgi:hypothetical protein
MAVALDYALVIALVPRNGLTFARLAARRDPDLATSALPITPWRSKLRPATSYLSTA